VVGVLGLALLSMLALLALRALSSARPRARLVAWNVAAVLGILLVFETSCWRLDEATRERNRRKWLDLRSMRSDADLGYAPRADRSIPISPGVAYTIDHDGFRSRGQRRLRDDAHGLLFFVDSFTFGEHVADEEPYPRRVADALGPAYAVFNLSYIGYGPHQMLAMLETGITSRVVNRRPTHAFYLALEDHVERAAGRRFWDVHGPRYVLEGGRPVRAGNFDDPWTPERSLLGASHLARRIAAGAGETPSSERFSADVRLFSAIVAEATRKLESAYPGIAVHILFWSAFSEHSASIRDGLARSGATVHDVVDVLGAFEHRAAYRDFAGYGSTSPLRFQLSETDLHPNPFAHAILADYVVEVVRGELPDAREAVHRPPERRDVGS
jgi:hypothetical protein